MSPTWSIGLNPVMPGRAFAPGFRSGTTTRASKGLNPVMPGRAFAPTDWEYIERVVQAASQSRDARESVRAGGLPGGDRVRWQGLNPVMPGRAFAPS